MIFTYSPNPVVSIIVSVWDFKSYIGHTARIHKWANHDYDFSVKASEHGICYGDDIDSSFGSRPGALIWSWKLCELWKADAYQNQKFLIEVDL
jgi:hypothetical protein